MAGVEFGPELVAGFGGAVVGGLISLATSAYFYNQQRRDARLVAAISVVGKIAAIADSVHKVRVHVQSAKTEAIDLPLWSGLRPIVGFTRAHIAFTPDELAIFALSGDATFVTTLFETASFHNLLMDVLGEFNARREELGLEISKVGEVATVEGDKRTTVIDEKAKAALDPLVANVTSLATSLESLAEVGAPDVFRVANSVCDRLASALRDDRFTLELKLGGQWRCL